MVKGMVKELSLGLMGKSMLGNGRKDDHMVKELKHYLMEESMLGNTRMGKEMVKEHLLLAMVTNI